MITKRTPANYAEALPDELLGELPGGVGVRFAELGPLQHLGGEPDEPARVGAVQDRERLVLLADAVQVEEGPVVVGRLGQEGAAVLRQPRHRRVGVGEDAGAAAERVGADAQERGVVRGQGPVHQVHVERVVPDAAGLAGVLVDLDPDVLPQGPPREGREGDGHLRREARHQPQEPVGVGPQRLGEVPEAQHGVSAALSGQRVAQRRGGFLEPRGGRQLGPVLLHGGLRQERTVQLPRRERTVDQSGFEFARDVDEHAEPPSLLGFSGCRSGAAAVVRAPKAVRRRVGLVGPWGLGVVPVARVGSGTSSVSRSRVVVVDLATGHAEVASKSLLARVVWLTFGGRERGIVPAARTVVSIGSRRRGRGRPHGRRGDTCRGPVHAHRRLLPRLRLLDGTDSQLLPAVSRRLALLRAESATCGQRWPRGADDWA